LSVEAGNKEASMGVNDSVTGTDWD
jgi:hypothetical protein